MTPSYRTCGFVFKKEDRSEADRVFTVFTKDYGRVEIFAKAIRRIASKLRGGIEMGSLSELEFVQGKYRKTLTDATVMEKFSQAGIYPEKRKVTNKINSLLDGFIKGQESDEKLFNLVVDFFNQFNSLLLPSNNYMLLYYYFFWNFIAVLGYGPDLSCCSRCHANLQPSHLYFSNKEGGIICGECMSQDSSAKKISADMVKVLRLFLQQDWQVITKLKMENALHQLLQIISDEYQYYLLESVS